ncbi:hypothetical protein LCGC14_0431110 [marine sediment metagenome]|uniref:Uncharacterized protein n=1 Tax=marine sediment metagenome TaxID=412755 RepID=A0A0F9VA48_9ZZZZ
MIEQAIKMLQNSTICPNFRGLPGDDENVWEVLAPYWTCCDYEEGCYYRDHCPAIPKGE